MCADTEAAVKRKMAELNYDIQNMAAHLLDVAEMAERNDGSCMHHMRHDVDYLQFLRDNLFNAMASTDGLDRRELEEHLTECREEHFGKNGEAQATDVMVHVSRDDENNP